MLPARFELHRPDSLATALALLDEYGEDASPYAGGTELLIAMKARVVRFAHIIDIKRIAELRGIVARDDGGLSIGALCSHHELANDPIVRKHAPAYARLSANIANIRVRVAGTLGGNLCFAEPHADPPALLCALGAEVCLAGSRGMRKLPLQDFILGELSTVRTDQELLVRIEVPGQPEGARAAYRAFGHLERPAAGVAAVAKPEGKGYAWRFFAGSMCGRPTALTLLEDAMAGQPPAEALESLERTAQAAVEHIETYDDLRGSADYKRHLVTVLALRSARAALGLEERVA
ncbi:MAG: FAD binding domain-containing protein [Burkholderiales bacterium]|nr:FAD binding domain-containing protein [Burkholderiales bacterium]